MNSVKYEVVTPRKKSNNKIKNKPQNKSGLCYMIFIVKPGLNVFFFNEGNAKRDCALGSVCSEPLKGKQGREKCRRQRKSEAKRL